MGPAKQKSGATRETSMVAAIAVICAIVVVGAFVGVVYWTTMLHQTVLQASRDRAVDDLAVMLGEAIEQAMADDDMDACSRLVRLGGQTASLQQCRVVLPDGRVVADIETGISAIQTLPERWDDTPGAVQIAPESNETRIRTVSLQVANRGGARLEIEYGYPGLQSQIHNAQVGVVVWGSFALLALLLVYRFGRSRMQGLAAIHGALLAMGQQSGESVSLRVSEAFGPEAQLWNRMLAERNDMLEQIAALRLADLASRGDQSSQGLSVACESLPQGILLIDSNSTITYANGASGSFLLQEQSSLQGASIQDVLTDESLRDAVASVVSGKMRRPFKVEIHQSHAATDVILGATVRPLPSGNTNTAIVVIEDVTQARMAEESRKTFVAQATHELRTPLTNIRLYAETAIDSGEEDATLRARCLNVINQEARRLERVVGEMLSVSEIEAGSLRLQRDDVPLKTLLDQLVLDYAPQADDKGIALSFELPPKYFDLRGDREKIMLVFHNLLGNALKYTPEGGSVRVRVESREERMTIEVSDNGIGLSPEDAAQVFDKFFRARDSRVDSVTGSGLGLALSREVVRMHGGEISVDSKLNEGTTFSVVFPAGIESKAA